MKNYFRILGFYIIAEFPINKTDFTKKITLNSR